MRCSRVGAGLIRVAHGWYATRQLEDWEKLSALMHILPGDSVIAGETAASLYGVDIRPAGSHRQPFRVCVARPEGRRAVRRPGIRCRVLRFETGDRIVRYGIRCTSPLRTALDLASTSTVELATHIFEIFLRRRLVTYGQLIERISQMRGRRGVVVLRRALAMAHPKSESVFETAVRIRLIEAGIEAPELQIPVRVPGRVNPFRLDLGWTVAGGKPVNLGLECDSIKYHPKAGPKAQADRERRKLIREQGWKVLSLRFGTLYGEEFTFENEVAAILGMKPRTGKRRKWWLSQWHLRRNAWTRSEKLHSAIA